MIKAIIFDCFGVLIAGGKTRISSYAPAENVEELRDLYVASDYGYIQRKEFLQQISKLTNLSVEDINEIIDKTYVRNAPLIEYVHTLKRNYKTGMLSNIGSDFIETLFSEKELTELFDDVVLSYEVGVVKPSAAIYELAAERLGVLPAECVFIDDLAVNCRGADDVGMKAIVYTNFNDVKTKLEALL